MRHQRPGTTIKAAVEGGRTIAYESIYQQLYRAIIVGHYAPGQTLTIRGLAEELGVSPMPVREAVRRLVGLGALEMHNTRRVSVSSLTRDSFREICTARSLLEPELATIAMRNISQSEIDTLKTIDAQLDLAIESGNAEQYSYKNWEFHFTFYRQSRSDLFLHLVESLWLRFGPFMRIVVGRIGTAILVDQHSQILHALETSNEANLRQAVQADIADGMEAIGQELFTAQASIHS